MESFLVRKVAFEISDNSIQASSSYAGPSVQRLTRHTSWALLSLYWNNVDNVWKSRVRLAQWYRARLRGEQSGFDALSRQPEITLGNFSASDERAQVTIDPSWLWNSWTAAHQYDHIWIGPHPITYFHRKIYHDSDLPPSLSFFFVCVQNPGNIFTWHLCFSDRHRSRSPHRRRRSPSPRRRWVYTKTNKPRGVRMKRPI